MSKLESPFKPNILSGLRVLLTGGGSGIGFEISRQFGLHGAKVMIMGRRQPVLEGAVQALKSEGIDAQFYCGDVRSYESCTAAVDAVTKAFGGLDCLVNAAAGNFLVPAEKMSPNAFATVHGIDVQGTFNMCRAAYEQLAKSKRSSIINISATLHLPATMFQTHASSAKAAVDSLTRNLSIEWGDVHIRVVGIAPGAIAGTPGAMKLGGAIPDGEKYMIDQIPLGRLGKTFDIAITAVFLASDAASYITGQTLIVDGGANNWRPAPLSKTQVVEFARAVEAKSRKTGVQSKL